MIGGSCCVLGLTRVVFCTGMIGCISSSIEIRLLGSRLTVLLLPLLRKILSVRVLCLWIIFEEEFFFSIFLTFAFSALIAAVMNRTDPKCTMLTVTLQVVEW